MKVLYTHNFEPPDDYYRSHNYHAMDLTIKEIWDRHEKSAMLLPKEIPKVTVPATEKSVYQQDIDAHKLELQLQMLPDLVKAFRKS